MTKDQHLFSLFGRYFLLDVPTSALLELDKEAYRTLSGSGQASPEVEAEIAALKEQGLLRSDPIRQSGRPADSPRWLKALCLHVAHDCNLRCTYCFAGSGRFGGAREIMTPETGRAAIALLLAESGPIDQLEVDFFGGEPLLALETVRAVVDYGRARGEAAGKRINFTLTTNAVALDAATMEYLDEQAISLVLSLDGRPEIHDRFRPAPGGQGSYALVAPRIQRAAVSRSQANYYVRGTFTRFNLDFTEDVRHLLALGLNRLSLEPVVSLPDEPYALRDQDLPRVEEEYERLAAFYLERALAGQPFTFFHFLLDLDHGPCLGKRLLGCGAGCRYLAVTPEGQLYPCHQFVGRPQFLLGDLAGGVVRQDLRESFAKADIFRKEGCLDCWARYFCGGGCHANADLHHGTILTPDGMGCRLHRKRLECALGIKAVLSEAAPEPA